MNVTGKAELAVQVAQMASITHTQARQVIDAVFERIAAETAVGNQVRIVGFGSFAVKERAARTARNPQTGLPVDVPARKALTFKPSKAAA